MAGEADGPHDSSYHERSMWRAVITQALMDAGSKSKKQEMRYDRAQAISWLSGTSPDFYAVCAMADLDPEYVKLKATQAIKQGCKWREESVKKPKLRDVGTAPRYEVGSFATENIIYKPPGIAV